MFTGAVRILAAATHDFSWPRERPVTNGLHTYTTSDLTVVEVTTDAGITGYGIGRPRPGEREIRADMLARIIGRDPMLTEAIWHELWSPKLTGRRGMETRALSSIDLALWDIKAKAANLPLYRLLGGFRQDLPFYMAGGYYGEGKTIEDLQAEFRRYVDVGARAVKMKVGAVPIAKDISRIKAVREAIGPDIRLMLDANCAYRCYEAVRLSRLAEPYDPFWLEEPVQPDDYDGFRKIAAAGAIPLAAGENEYTKYGFRDLIATGAVAILNPDARYVGGVTEFVKVAALAQAAGLDICPHGEQQAHVHLVAALPNALYIEYYPESVKPMTERAYLYPAAMNDDGTIAVPENPGAALDPDWDALERHRLRCPTTHT